ncbi:hypothetical protein NQ176_g2505 [Zarea fungicola]|uniref:Uncharacterized protein n=1 Tax=Zarea fungicola TaxID=93591 RepID=A0ACC1NNK0_9HYPO|nr:hypothetical protein NQ176_g2505 [Lecanicillium fungicola]
MIATSQQILGLVPPALAGQPRESLPPISDITKDLPASQYRRPHVPSRSHPQSHSSGLPSPSALQYGSNSRPKSTPTYASSPKYPGLLPTANRRLNRRGKPYEPQGGSVHNDHRSVSGYPQSSAPTSHPYQLNDMPSGQLPLPTNFPPSSDPPPNSIHNRAPRPYENWSYQESFSRIGSHSRTIFNFAEAYGRVAQEHGGDAVPERLPTQREVNEMIANVDYIKRVLEQVGQVVQHTEQARAHGPRDEENRNVNIHNDGMKPRHPVNMVKKRRGRAAPPDLCHSCNRIDTPEWRRGPDGARTLCNACGLHYAKLERKRQLEARSLPKVRGAQLETRWQEQRTWLQRTQRRHAAAVDILRLKTI